MRRMYGGRSLRSNRNILGDNSMAPQFFTMSFTDPNDFPLKENQDRPTSRMFREEWYAAAQSGYHELNSFDNKSDEDDY